MAWVIRQGAVKGKGEYFCASPARPATNRTGWEPMRQSAKEFPTFDLAQWAVCHMGELCRAVEEE